MFLPSLVEVLPSVFANLTSPNLTLRTQAAHALLSLSHAFAHLPSPPGALLASLAQATSTYLTEQHQARKTLQDLSPLGEAFHTCLDADIPAHAAQSPMWALSVTAAIVVLSGGEALTRPRTIKFVLGHLQTAMTMKKTTVRATAGLVWRVLVWACLRLDAGLQSQEQRDAGWKVVRQIVDGAIGISVVAALVGPKERKAERVTQALDIVKTMVRKGGRTCEEGVDVLERLVCGVGIGIEEHRAEGWSNEKLLADQLFDGTLLQAEAKSLATHIKDALVRNVTVNDVRSLQEDEVMLHWDTLFTIWKDAVERAPLGEDGEVPVHTTVISSCPTSPY